MNGTDWAEKERKKNLEAQRKFERDLIIEKRKSEDRRRDNELRDIRNQNRYNSERRTKFTTSKLLMYIILANCSIIEIYSMWIMYYLSDLSALYSLIGAVVGESISYAIYCAKSFNDSKEEAKNQLERDKFDAEQQIINNANIDMSAEFDVGEVDDTNN